MFHIYVMDVFACSNVSSALSYSNCYFVQGIGRAVAKALVEGGAETYALSRTQADLDSLKAEVYFFKELSLLL